MEQETYLNPATAVEQPSMSAIDALRSLVQQGKAGKKDSRIQLAMPGKLSERLDRAVETTGATTEETILFILDYVLPEL